MSDVDRTVDGVRSSGLVSVLSSGSAPPVVVVDFNEFTARTTLAQTVADLGRDRAVYRIDAAAVHEDLPDRSVPQLAAACAAELRALGVTPEIVMGFCNAAVLSLHLVKALGSGPGREPELHLIEPSWLTPELIRQEVQIIATGLSGNDLPYEGGLGLSDIDSFLQEALREELVSQDVPPDEIEFCLPMLGARYRTWFGFLLRTLEAPVPTEVLPRSLALSQDGARTPHPSWPAHIRVEVLPQPTGALLGSGDAADFVRSILAEARA